MKIISRILFILLLLFFSFALSPRSCFAADFTTDYQVEYFLTESAADITSLVRFNIKITHLRSDIYVKKFSLQFPNVFPIKGVTASDDKGPLAPQITDDGKNVTITIEQSDPNTGKDSVNNINLQFTQGNLFKVNGNVWEVILPTIENHDNGNYQIIVNLPVNSGKKLSVAKPQVDQIDGNRIIWNNPKTKTVYAVFGNTQYYQTDLVYNLRNPKLYPGYVDVAFPPDTLYQAVNVNQINPRPDKIFIDDDGNYIGRYNLGPKETKIISFDADISVFSDPREDFKKILSRQIEKQKSYLLTAKDYWQLTPAEKYSNLKTVPEIYYYLVNNFTYDYSKLTSKTSRMGAENALKQPNQAVCTEFTDSFVALARENGIYAREIEGYGFSSDPQLRPMSLTNDLLHAWPEYFDKSLGIWKQADPTWENTSGIDYLSSFDLNHIAFAIHGKDPSYPYPAGTYKITDSKDILIKPVASIPKKTGNLTVAIGNISSIIYSQSKYQGKITINNESNTFLYNISLSLNNNSLLWFSQNNFYIDQIAPYETREIGFDYQPQRVLSKKTADIELNLDDKKMLSQSVTILPVYYDLAIKFGYVGLGLLFFVAFYMYAKRKNK